MKPILFESTETSFTSNGLGRIDALSCQVTEARNGQFDLEMVVSIDDEHYGDIKEGRILYVRHDETQDKQPFDIYYISRPLDGKVTVLARHISYRTGKITVNPFTASSIALAFTQMKSQSIGNNPFTFWTDKVVNGNFNVAQPKTIRQLLAGEQGSILDVYGTGEYEWDKWTIKLHLHRGTDSGVVLRYGKDITELKKTTDTTNIWTGVVPFWYGTPQSDSESENDSSSSEEVLVMLPEKYILADNSSEFGSDMIVPLDLTSVFDDVPTEEQLRQAAQRYVSNNSISEIPTTIEFSFINLAALDEYKNVAALQRLKLCDTVTVIYDKLGVSNTKKIIQTVFDVLTEKYVSMTVGDTASNLSSTLTDAIKDSVDQLRTDTQRNIATTRSKLETKFQQTITEQTELITGGSGGNVVLKRNGDGKPTDILIMDNEDMNRAVQVLRLNVNGIGFSSHGINGPYGSAWTLDGRFNANYISTGELNAALIKVGTLTDVNGLNYWNMETGEFSLSSSTKVGGSTVSQIASSAVSTYDTSLNQQAVFNKLTNNGETQGIYLQNGKLYINATYINSGTMSADYIQGGTLTLGGYNNNYGQLIIKNSSGNIIGTWDRNGIDIDSGSIDIGNGKFSVSSEGKLTCQGADIQGTIYSENDSSYYYKSWVRIDSGVIEGGYGNSLNNGYINFNGVWGNGDGVHICGGSSLTLEADTIYSLYNNTLTRAETGDIRCVYQVAVDYVDVDYNGSSVSVGVGIRYWYNDLHFENGLLMDYGYGGSGT